jgi:hypothetical protein
LRIHRLGRLFRRGGEGLIDPWTERSPISISSTTEKLLAQEMDGTKRQTILRLLAEEEAKLASLTNPPRQKASP